MQRKRKKSDDYDRTDPKIYFGEYAVTRESGTGNLQAAIGEAAFMTGLERNGDVVMMSSYAPLFSNESWKAWNPNAIVFDQARLYGTPSYWVQTMFGANRPDRVLPVQIEQPERPVESIRGTAGVGTWGASAEFKDIKATKGDQTLFVSDFLQELEGWKLTGEGWQAMDGVLRQSSEDSRARALTGDPTCSDYTLTLKARKLSGQGSFVIVFGSPGSETMSGWILSGRENKDYALVTPGVDFQRVSGSIETGRWYDIRIELRGPTVKCYLDGQLVQTATRSNTA